MAKSDSIRKVQSFVNDLPLEDILNSAEVLAGVLPIPYLPTIIKVLRVLVGLRPAASGIMGLSADIADRHSENYQARENFKNLFDIALSDGEITPDEKEFLRPRALAAGISDDEFELMVMNKINIINE